MVSDIDKCTLQEIYEGYFVHAKGGSHALCIS